MKASVFVAALAVAHGLPSPAAAQEPKRPEAALLNPLAAIDPAKLDGFLGRPLFSPTRRPPPAAPSEPPAEVAAEAPAAPPSVRLVGIVRTPKESIAQLVQGDGGERLSVRVGDFLDDWIVADIGASTVTLKRGDGEARLDIFGSAAIGEAGEADASPSAPEKSRQGEWTKEEIEGFFGAQK